MSWWIDSFAEGYKSIFDWKFIPIISAYPVFPRNQFHYEWLNEMRCHIIHTISSWGSFHFFFHSSQFRRIFHHVHHPGVTKNGPLTRIIIFDEKEPIFHRAFYVLFSPNLRSMCVCVWWMGKFLPRFLFSPQNEKGFSFTIFSRLFSHKYVYLGWSFSPKWKMMPSPMTRRRGGWAPKISTQVEERADVQIEISTWWSDVAPSSPCGNFQPDFGDEWVRWKCLKKDWSSGRYCIYLQMMLAIPGRAVKHNTGQMVWGSACHFWNRSFLFSLDFLSLSRKLMTLNTGRWEFF